MFILFSFSIKILVALSFTKFNFIFNTWEKPCIIFITQVIKSP